MAKRGENIYKRKDGRYEGRYVIGRTSDGRTQFGYVYGKTYTEVHRQLLLHKAELLKASPKRTHAGISFDEWMNRLFSSDRFMHLKPRSLQTYLLLYEKHIMPCFACRDIGRISVADVHQFIHILNRKKLAPATISNILRLLSISLKAAQAEGLISQDPCSRISFSQQSAQEQRVLTITEQEQIKAAAMKKGNLAVLLAMYTGMRLGEICALQWQDIDWSRRTISVRRTAQRMQQTGESTRTAVMIGTPKTNKSRRVIPLPDRLIDLLAAHQARSETVYIFGRGDRPAEPRNLQRQFATLIRPLGLNGVHFHTLRHTFATRMLELGVDVKTVSVLLGHSSTRITLDYYAHSLIEQQRAAMDKMSQVLF